MRIVSRVALALLGVAALGAIPDTLTCGPSPLGYCGNNLLWSALLFFLGFCGCILALVASIQGIARSARQRQWDWLLALVGGSLVPLPTGLLLGSALGQVYGPNAVQALLPVSAGLLLTPLAALVYSWRYPPQVAADVSPRLVPTAETEALRQAVPATAAVPYPSPPAMPGVAATPVRGHLGAVRRQALAATATLGLVLTACFIGPFILTAQYGHRAVNLPGFGILSLLWIFGLVVTGGALVWATVLALRMKRWGWAIALVLGTLGLVFVTLDTLPGLLILVYAIWGPAERQVR